VALLQSHRNHPSLHTMTCNPLCWTPRLRLLLSTIMRLRLSVMRPCGCLIMKKRGGRAGQQSMHNRQLR
jgi:hypothetical protein